MGSDSFHSAHQKLADDYRDCGECRLCDCRNSVVFGSGALSADLLIVSGAPGDEEDRVGSPVQGAAGEKLDRILKYLEVTRSDVYISGSIMCRPPNNRDPAEDELSACRKRLYEEIALIKPSLIVIMGKIATKQVLLDGEEFNGPLKQFFGINHKLNINGHLCEGIVTYTPNYIIKNPSRSYEEVLPHWTKVKEWISKV